MRTETIAGMDTILTQTTDAVRGDLNAALRGLLRENLATLEGGGDELVARLADSRAERLQTALTLAMACAADSAGYAVTLGLRRGIDRELAPAFIRVLDSLRAAMPRKFARLSTGRDKRWNGRSGCIQ
jgi:hypothetical protein